MSFYEIVVTIIGPLPQNMQFLYSVVAVVCGLWTIAACVSLILLPIAFLKR